MHLLGSILTDKGYLEEKKIKFMSFHGYLRGLVDGLKLGSVFDSQFVPPLDLENFSVMVPCPGGKLISKSGIILKEGRIN